MNRILATLVVVVTATALVGMPAQAQLYDHMKCYKIKDTAKFSADTTLDALQQQFGLNDACRIKGKGKLFCVPVDKTSVTNFVDKSKTGIPQVAYDGPEYLNDRICYKVKCPPANLAPEQVTDQFGTRNIEKFKPMLLCTPAVKGIPTTTTTTLLFADGTPCTGSQQCLSGSCFDGVCCASNSCSICEACNVTGSEGVCALVPAGTDPHSDCSAQTCIGSTLFDQICDGSGMCMVGPSSQPCDPYACNGNGTACLTACVIDGDCANGNYCDAGSCVALLPNGAFCSTSNQCQSGNCLGGICVP